MTAVAGLRLQLDDLPARAAQNEIAVDLVVACADQTSADALLVPRAASAAAQCASSADVESLLVPLQRDEAADAAASELPLPQPDEHCSPQRVRVVWRAGAVHSPQRLVFGAADDRGAQAVVERPLVIRIDCATNARVPPEQRTAIVNAVGTAGHAPKFHVSGLHVVHWGESLHFSVQRAGAPSALPSHVQWSLEYLHAIDDSAAQAVPAALLDARVAALRPTANVSAALGAQRMGALVWGADSMQSEREVTVPIEWDMVPYDSRWMLAVRLSPVSNARVRAQDAVDSASAAALRRLSASASSDGAAAGPAEAGGALAGATAPVLGQVAGQSAQVHFIVYGAPRGACLPGFARASGSAAAVPLHENATVAARAGAGLLGFFAQYPEHGASGTQARFKPPATPYNQTTASYALALPHDAGVADVVFLALEPLELNLAGCSRTDAPASPIWAKRSKLPGVDGSVYAMRWHPDVADGAHCTAEVQVCRGRAPCSASGAASDAIDGVSSTRDAFNLTIYRQLDPAVAQIAATFVSIAGESAQVCGRNGSVASGDSAPAPAPGPAAASQPRCATRSATRINALSGNATAADPACALPECDDSAPLHANVTYERGDEIIVRVAPLMTPGVGSTLAIGQRIFRFDADDSDPAAASALAPADAPQSAHMPDASAARFAEVRFTLFDRFDKLSPFVPFFIRERSAEEVTLDVPIAHTLSDLLTSTQQNLTLTVHVVAPPPPPQPLHVTAAPGGSQRAANDSAGAGAAGRTETVQPASPDPTRAPADTTNADAQAAEPSAAPAIVLTVPEVVLDGTVQGALAPASSSNSSSSGDGLASRRKLRASAAGAYAASGDIKDTALRIRKLQSATSARAPEGQAWLDDPLDNGDCARCPAGSYSYTCVHDCVALSLSSDARIPKSALLLGCKISDKGARCVMSTLQGYR